MAPPISSAALLTVLRDEGLTVVEVGNWAHHNRDHKGPFGPVHGVMIHHTVTSGSARTVQMCRDGYAGLPGPLCHGVITKDGRVHLVGHGRANHAGLGDDDVLDAVIAEAPLPPDNEANTDGNARYYGFECENLGDGRDPWPAVQLEAIERAGAAICRYHGWNERSVLGHLEWQPGKIDPKGFTMASMRRRIRGRLELPPPGTSGRTYEVRAGDTLWAIARETGVSVAALVDVNDLSDPNVIRRGQELKLPAGASAPKPTPPTAYRPPAMPSGLRPNSISPSARGLQRALKKAGLMSKGVPEADNYGPKTQAAVARFHNRYPQFRATGVSRDIHIGPKGWAHLHELAYGGRS